MIVSFLLTFWGAAVAVAAVIYSSPVLAIAGATCCVVGVVWFAQDLLRHRW